MTHMSRTSLYATAAISAALAFGSTPVLAQATAPAITLPPAAEAPASQTAPEPQTVPAPEAAAAPQAAPAAQPAPTIVLPSSVTAPSSEPVAEEAAPASSPAPEPAATSEEPRPKAARQRAAAPEPAAAPAPQAQEQAAPDAGVPAETALPAAAAEVPAPADPMAAPNDAPAAQENERASVPSEIDVPDGIIAASVLGVIGLGIAGFIATRRRRGDKEMVESDYEPDPEFVAEAPVTSIPEELAVHEPDRKPEPTSFEMPEGPVPTGEARNRLIEEMAAAAPDEANPFTSYKARRKRARIILQSREQRQREQGAEPFDWRTYRSPAIPDPTSPPMVDA